ncbi:MAG TPA: ferric reductase-like transmembrane domain-containing protein, partial [Thermomicrobiales bacterium]|nr:ferric reductase-like transmembrane domain-containing protein [Thermomicrobiales bacterium]
MSLDTTNGSLLWYLGRGSGITAFLLVTVAVALGIAVSRRWFAGPIPRLVVHDLHRWVTLTFYVFVALHVVTIWLDPFTHFRLVDVLVPFASTYRPLWMSLGIIAAELSIAVGASVWVRSRIGYRAWHALHGLTYPIFLASLVHGLGTGTDTRTTWATGLYAGSVALVAGLWAFGGGLPFLN